MRFIDADKLFETRFSSAMRTDDNDALVPLSDVVRMIKLAPTVDAVEVVRCEHCQYADVMVDPFENKPFAYCKITHMAVPLTHFCASGK